MGLKKGMEVRGKTGLINYHTINTGEKKAEMKLRKSAAPRGFPFIVITSDKTRVGASSNQFGGSQAIKKGITYKW